MCPFAGALKSVILSCQVIGLILKSVLFGEEVEFIELSASPKGSDMICAAGDLLIKFRENIFVAFIGHPSFNFE
jgi:hypothetical protein